MKYFAIQKDTIAADAAQAASAVIMDEFCPHCPNGIAHAINDRLCAVIEAAIESVLIVRLQARVTPSRN